MQDIGIISVDDHLVEPPHLWERWLPKKFADRGPRVQRIPPGRDAWVFEDQVNPIMGNAAAIGRSFDPGLQEVTYDEMRPGCYDPVARLADMDAAGMVASLNFPLVPGFSGTVFSTARDLELGLACIRAYNDFMIDEWCAAAPSRYIPMVLVPLWDPALAVAEIQRTAAKGARAIAFTEDPVNQGFPSLHDPRHHWDPVFAAAQDAEMPLCVHMCSSSTVVAWREDRPQMTELTLAHFNSIISCVDWLTSGVFERFDGLKVCFSEGGIGWLPHVIEDCDRNFKNHARWTGSGLTSLPSTLVKDHIFGCFIDDPHGARSVYEIGVDNVMVEVDYPHADSTWPDSEKVLKDQLQGVDEDELVKIFRGNAERIFHFTAPEASSS